MTRNGAARVSWLLTCVTIGLSRIAGWCVMGEPPWGHPWTLGLTLPHGRDGLNARRMAVLWTFRAPSLCRHGHREFMRNAALDLPPMIPTTACHQRNYVERYSRCNGSVIKIVIHEV